MIFFFFSNFCVILFTLSTSTQQNEGIHVEGVTKTALNLPDTTCRSFL